MEDPTPMLASAIVFFLAICLSMGCLYIRDDGPVPACICVVCAIVVVGALTGALAGYTHCDTCDKQTIYCPRPAKGVAAP